VAGAGRVVRPRARRKAVSLHLEQRWRLYANDPELFFRECVWVPAGEKMGKGAGRVRLDLFGYQQEALDVFRNERYVVVLKARQLGFTTIAMALALWELMFRPGSNIVLVSRSQTAADKALELIDFMHQFLPESVKARGPQLDNNAAKHHSYRFADGMVSQITSYAATKTVAAGQTASRVIWDEAALAENQEDVLRTLLPTTDAGGSMIVFSTARGGHNAFARLYRDAKTGQNQFKSMFYPWSHSHLVSEADYEAKRQGMRDEPWRFYAEYPSSDEEAFRQSGRSRFPNLPEDHELDTGWLRGFLRPGVNGPEFLPNAEGPLRILPEALDGPPPGAVPVVALDPATGNGGDYTAMAAGWLDEDGTPQRMAFWHSNMVEPVEAALEASYLGELFTDDKGMPALMVVEKQGGYGDSIIHELRENLLYQNLYRFTYTGHRRRRADQAYGFPMTYARRPLVIDTLAKWVDRDGSLMVGIDPILRQELGAFVAREDGRVMGDAGMTDDMVMATAIFVYVLSERGLWAMPEAIDEDSWTPVYSVKHIFDEADKVRRDDWRDDRRRGRRRGRGSYVG
jgi:hypothetical protein